MRIIHRTHQLIRPLASPPHIVLRLPKQCDPLGLDELLCDRNSMQRRLLPRNLCPGRRVRYIHAVCELRVILSFVLQPEFHGDGARPMIRKIIRDEQGTRPRRLRARRRRSKAFIRPPQRAAPIDARSDRRGGGAAAGARVEGEVRHRLALALPHC